MRLRPANGAAVSLSALLAAGCSGQDGPPSGPLVLLAPAPYTELILEVDAVEGLALRDAARDRALSDFEDLVGKPVSWAQEAPLSAVEVPDGGWTGDDLVALARRSWFGDEEDAAHLQILLLPGAWAEAPEDTLALSWEYRHVAVFSEVIEALCTGWTGEGKVEEACEEVERAVLLHELGHVVGLVDDGLPMVEDHEDPEYPGHDIDEDCVMNASVRGTRILDQIKGSLEDRELPLDFGEACRADVDAVQLGE